MLTVGAASVRPQVKAESEEKLKVMPLGDSITDGFSTVGGYRNSLCSLLQENGYSDKIDFVGPNWGGSGYDPQHAGFSGYSIDNIAQEDSISGQRTGLSSFIDWLMETYPADVVMLQIGTNDILSLYDLDNIGTRLESLVDTILTYIPDDGMLYLATIPCMDANNTLYINEYYFTVESMDAYIDAYNAQIREIVERKAAQGENIQLADVNVVLDKSDLYDGVHPTESGYAKMGEFWYEKLADYLQGSAGEEKYSAADLVILYKYVTKVGTITVQQAEKLDMNGDKLLNSLDITLLRKAVLEQQ